MKIFEISQTLCEDGRRLVLMLNIVIKFGTIHFVEEPFVEERARYLDLLPPANLY